MKRCKWCNLNNKLYVEYHDNEWGNLNTNDNYLFEMLVLESFQAGLSWECILNKRENFRASFDNFDYNLISKYDNGKINLLLKDYGIIRNKKKIESTIKNAKIFINILNEYGSFYNYLKKFTKGKIYYFDGYRVSNTLSDKISKDLYNRGMRYVGTKIIYSYLQAIGIINDHEETCFLYKK